MPQKLLVITFGIICFIGAIGLMLAVSDEVRSIFNNQKYGVTEKGMITPGYFEKCNFEGHDYLLFKGEQRSGIVHDPNCHCHRE